MGHLATNLGTIGNSPGEPEIPNPQGKGLLPSRIQDRLLAIIQDRGWGLNPCSGSVLEDNDFLDTAGVGSVECRQ